MHYTSICERSSVKNTLVSLISHVTKLVFRIVINRIRGRILHEIAPEQYGFIPDIGTVNAILVMWRLVEGAVEKKKLYRLYTCFIDNFYSTCFRKYRHAVV